MKALYLAAVVLTLTPCVPASAIMCLFAECLLVVNEQAPNDGWFPGFP